MACGISYESGPNAGCSGTAPVVGISIVGSLAVAIVSTIVVANFLRGAMSAKDAASLLSQMSAPDIKGSPVTLVDGTQLPLLDTAGQAAVSAYMNDLIDSGRARRVTQRGLEYDYQRAKLGDIEYDITRNGGARTWADDVDQRRGAAQDAKFRNPTKPTSFYDPSSLSPKMRSFAITEMQRRLVKYKQAIDDPSNPLQALEVVTNDVGAAQFIREQMVAMGVPGFIRVEV